MREDQDHACQQEPHQGQHHDAHRERDQKQRPSHRERVHRHMQEQHAEDPPKGRPLTSRGGVQRIDEVVHLDGAGRLDLGRQSQRRVGLQQLGLLAGHAGRRPGEGLRDDGAIRASHRARLNARIVRRFDDDIDAPSEIAEDRPSVAFERRHNFDHA